QLVAFEPKGAGAKIVSVFQPEFVVLTGRGQVVEASPANDPLRGQVRVVRGRRNRLGRASRVYDANAAEGICERLPASVTLAIVLRAVEQLQQSRSEPPAKFLG